MDAVHLALRAVRDGKPERTHEVIQWFTNYFDRPEFSKWLKLHGGWVKVETRFFFW